MTGMKTSNARGQGVQVGDGRAFKTADLAKLIATAFEPLEPCRYLVPEPGHRLAVMGRFFELEVAAAKEHGEVLVTGDHRGVALWLPRSGQPAEVPELTEDLAKAVGDYAENFVAFERELSSHHPTGRAYVHLTELAVLPRAQRSGLGSAMLNLQHALLDAAGTPAYLEAASLRLTTFYECHGYERHGDPIVLPDGVQMYPMLREPQQR